MVLVRCRRLSSFLHLVSVLSPDVCGAILSAALQFWNGAGLKIHQHRFLIDLLVSMEDFLRLYQDESFTFSPAPLRQSRGDFGVQRRHVTLKVDRASVKINYNKIQHVRKLLLKRIARMYSYEERCREL